LGLPLPFGDSGSSALPFFAGTSLPDLAAIAVFFVSLLGFASGFAFAAALTGVLVEGLAFTFAVDFVGAAGFLAPFTGALTTGFVALVIGLADLAIGFFTAFAGATAFLGAAFDAGLDLRTTAFLVGILAVVATFFAGALEVNLLLAGATDFFARGLDLLAAGVFFTGFALFLILLLGIGLRSLA
jgi:hypothetical protein